MSSVLALDLAFIFSDSEIEAAFKINDLCNLSFSGFRFDENHIPHLTLFQSYVQKENIDELGAQVEKAIKSFTIDLFAPFKSDGFCSKDYTEPDAKTYDEQYLMLAYWMIKKDKRLIELQNNIAKIFNSFDSISGQPNSFYKSNTQNGSQEAYKSDCLWVENYKNNSIGLGFSPHLTLGIYDKDNIQENEVLYPFGVKSLIQPEKLVLSQLGKTCTLSSNFFLSLSR